MAKARTIAVLPSRWMSMLLESGIVRLIDGLAVRAVGVMRCPVAVVVGDGGRDFRDDVERDCDGYDCSGLSEGEFLCESHGLLG